MYTANWVIIYHLHSPTTYGEPGNRLKQLLVVKMCLLPVEATMQMLAGCQVGDATAECGGLPMCLMFFFGYPKYQSNITFQKVWIISSNQVENSRPRRPDLRCFSSKNWLKCMFNQRLKRTYPHTNDWNAHIPKQGALRWRIAFEF